MNSARMRAELRALKTRVDALLEEVERDIEAGPSANDASSPALIRPTPQQYADMMNVEVGTVYTWLKHGLPHVKHGREYRIKLPDAEGWTMPKAIETSADKSAHRGGKR